MSRHIPLSYFIAESTNTSIVMGCLPNERALLQTDPRLSPFSTTKIFSCAWFFIPVVQEPNTYYIHNETTYVDNENVFLSVDENNHVVARKHHEASCWVLVPESLSPIGEITSFSLQVKDSSEFICVDPSVPNTLLVSSTGQRIVWDVIVHDELVEEP